MPDFIPAAAASAIPVGTGITTQIAGHEIAIFNLDGEFCAIDGECPHRGGPLGSGTVEDGKVFCPLHGWEFDLRTGACATRPDKPAHCHSTRVVNGQVEVQVGSSPRSPIAN
jgi:nitrite reductase/ring-hydroxylating ferredoxin subunit